MVKGWHATLTEEKDIMMRKSKSALVTGLAMLALLVGASPRAEAAPITGGLTFGGSWLPTGAGTNIVGATGVDVLGNFAFVTCAAPGVASCTGSYAPLNGNVIGATYNDFQFNPLSAPSPLWTFGFGGLTYSFSLASLTIVTQNATTLGLVGTGTLFISGFTPTAGSWSFSGDTTTGSTTWPPIRTSSVKRSRSTAFRMSWSASHRSVFPATSVFRHENSFFRSDGIRRSGPTSVFVPTGATSGCTSPAGCRPA